MCTSYDKVLEFIGTFNGRDKHYYTNGGCYGFYKKLKHEFPCAVGYYDSNHVITKIGDRFFDVTGEVKPNFRHLEIETNYGFEHMEKSFNKQW